MQWCNRTNRTSLVVQMQRMLIKEDPWMRFGRWDLAFLGVRVQSLVVC